MAIMTMQDIKSELRDKEIQRKHKDMLRGSSTALRLRLHTEGFQLSTIGSSTKGSPLRNYKYKSGIHNSNSLTILCTRGRH